MLRHTKFGKGRWVLGLLSLIVASILMLTTARPAWAANPIEVSTDGAADVGGGGGNALGLPDIVRADAPLATVNSSNALFGSASEWGLEWLLEHASEWITGHSLEEWGIPPWLAEVGSLASWPLMYWGANGIIGIAGWLTQAGMYDAIAMWLTDAWLALDGPAWGGLSSFGNWLFQFTLQSALPTIWEWLGTIASMSAIELILWAVLVVEVVVLAVEIGMIIYYGGQCIYYGGVSGCWNALFGGSGGGGGGGGGGAGLGGGGGGIGPIASVSPPPPISPAPHPTNTGGPPNPPPNGGGGSGKDCCHDANGNPIHQGECWASVNGGGCFQLSSCWLAGSGEHC